MAEIQELVRLVGTVEEQCQELAKVLGLGQPVTREVLYGALYDATYAHNLLVSKDESVFLRYLLQHPPKVAMPEPHVQEQSNGELVRSASQALWRWAKTGFSTLDDAAFAKRYAICMQCPHLQAAPESLLYQVATAGAKGSHICGLCGCLVDRKARLPHESCPGEHPTMPGFTRWEEPLPAARGGNK